MKKTNNRKFDVIVVGELNIDLILDQVDSFPETGKEKLAHEMTFTLGSSSAIFASNLSALGLKVAFVGIMGDDLFGQFCKQSLEKKGVDTSNILVSDELKTGATVVLNLGEDRANVTYQGSMKYLSVDDITDEILLQASHLHFSSYFLQDGFKGKADMLFEKAREAGLTTSLDIQWDPAEKWDFDYKKILPLVDIFLPNEKELLNITKQSDMAAAIQRVRDYANLIVVKRGAAGSTMFYNRELIPCKAFSNPKVVDAIGAGDSFNAGFIYYFMQDRTPVDCQKFANLAGAISTTKAGGTGAFNDLRQIMEIVKDKFGYED